MRVLCVLAIAIGAAILVYSLFIYYNALSELKKHMGASSLFSDWVYLACTVMMLFFLVGYIVNLVFVLGKPDVTSQDLLISAIFFSGSVFVYAMVTMMRRMFNTIRAKAMLDKQYIQLKELKEELVKAKELAEQGNRVKSEFLSRMSHEMLTPINVIAGMTEIGLSTSYENQKDNCLNKIKTASTELHGLINGVLDMSNIEIDNLKPAFNMFSLTGMLIKTTDTFKRKMAEKQLEFTINVDRDIPLSIYSDERRLTQVVHNILSNSVKFTGPHGAVSLSVTNCPEDNGCCRLRFEINDTGIGITEEAQTKLFTPFEQADGGASRKYGGIGLGLTISKRIVEMLGGTISVSSVVGQGTDVVFDILAESSSQVN